MIDSAESHLAHKKFGEELIAPILELFCARLHASLQAASINQTLFCMRAGIRLREVFNIWLSRNGIDTIYHNMLFPISRIAAIRAASHTQNQLVAAQRLIESMNNQSPLEAAISFLSIKPEWGRDYSE